MCYNINRFKKLASFLQILWTNHKKKYTIYMKVNILTTNEQVRDFA